MPVGDFQIGAYRHALLRGFIRRFGTLDLHTHLRLRPLLRIFDSLPRAPLTAVEVGCGSGINLIELARRRPLQGVGFDTDLRAIREARRLAAAMQLPGLRFERSRRDGRAVLPPADLVLLMDVLEHVADPAGLLRYCADALNPGGALLISVPTPAFPRVFGRAQHAALGHRVDGYALAQLQALVPAGFTLESHRYSTGALAALACAVFYRLQARAPGSRALLALRLPLHLARMVDRFNGPHVSCSLFAVFRRCAPGRAPNSLN